MRAFAESFESIVERLFVRCQAIASSEPYGNVAHSLSFNEAAKKATKKHIVLAHDDMYFCPGWDIAFSEELEKLKIVEPLKN